MERFLLCLNGKRVQRDGDDRVLWNGRKSGKFSVRSLYKFLESSSLVSFPMKIIWKPWVQPKVSFFAM